MRSNTDGFFSPIAIVHFQVVITWNLIKKKKKRVAVGEDLSMIRRLFLGASSDHQAHHHDQRVAGNQYRDLVSTNFETRSGLT